MRAARDRRGLSQEVLGQLVGVRGATIGNYERGLRTPSTTVLGLLARHLDLSVKELREAAKATREIRRRDLPEQPASSDRQAEFLRGVFQTLSDQVEELSEAVAYLERERV